MTRPVLTVRADEPIEQASALLTEHTIAAAPVLDAAGDLVGMVSEGDLLRGRVAPDVTGQRQARYRHEPGLVRDVMATNVVVMAPEADLADVAQAMLDQHVRSVPIVDDAGELTGIVSRHDILRTLVRTDDITQLDVQHRLDEYVDGQRRWTAIVRDGAVTIEGTYADDAERSIVAVLARTVPGVSTVHLRDRAPA
jgi:CBS domain-containing protein